MAQSSDLDALLRDALAEIAFDKSAPAQARVAALKELRQVLEEDRGRGRGPGEIDPGAMSLDDIERELASHPPPGTERPAKSTG